MDTVKKLREELQELQAQRNRLIGSRDTLLARLKNELGLGSIREAEAEVVKLEADIATQEAEYAALEKEYRDAGY